MLFLASKFIYFIIREKSADVRFVQRSVVLVSKFIYFIIRGKKVLMLLDLFKAVLFLSSKFIYFITRGKRCWCC